MNSSDEVDPIARLVFDVDLAEQATALRDAVHEFRQAMQGEGGSSIVLPDWLPLPSKRRQKRAIAKIDTLIWSLIRDKNATSWVAVLKSAFGFGIGCGLYALVTRAISPHWFISGYDVFVWQPTLGGAIGAVYGGFVELDDAIGDDGSSKSPPPQKEPQKKLPAKKG